ncbi:MAG: HD domain-containing protein [Tenericutes bacterium]|nr:HD domain-containing protein [Mycoplasmatota bacterium]
MKNIKSKLLLQINLFFAIVMTAMLSVAFSDSQLIYNVFTPVAGLYTAFLVVYGKKSVIPSLLGITLTMLIGRMAFIEEAWFISLLIAVLFGFAIVLQMYLFAFLLNKRITKTQRINRDLSLKDLPYYLFVVGLVALLGAITQTGIGELFYPDVAFLKAFLYSFLGLAFGMGVFNGAVIFGYYNDVRIPNRKRELLFNSLYILVFIGFSVFIFVRPDSIAMLKDFGFIFLFLYILVGLFASYHMLVFNNLAYMLFYSIFVVFPNPQITFTDMLINVNLFLVIANLAPIIIKLIMGAYIKKSELVKESLNVINKIVASSELHFSKMKHVSIDPELFFRNFLADMFELGAAILPKADRGSCYINDGENLEFVQASGYDLKLLNDLKFISSVSKRELYGPTVVTNTDTEIAVENKELFPTYIEEYGVLKESVRFNLIFKGTITGEMSFDISEGSNESFTEEDLENYYTFYKLLEGNLGMGDLLYKNNKMINNIIISFVRTVGVFDEYTRIHSEEVADLSSKISDILDLDSEIRDITYYSSVVHDIGKISVSPDILNKQGKLTNAEYALVKDHTIHGYDILSQIDGLENIAKNIRHHHERWDGFGYPDGLKAEEIPFVSQIIGVCDAVSAMMNKRVYSRAKTIPEIIAELKSQRAKQFSPVVCDAMILLLSAK